MRLRLLGTVLLGCGLASGVVLAGDEQRQLELIAQLPFPQQRSEAIQRTTQGLLRRAVLLYIARLDGLSCRQLFSLGDPAIFLGAIGNADGSERNLVYVGGQGNPRHLDGGAYIFPGDLPRNGNYYPPTANINTYWHETNHALLYEAGLEIETGPYADAMDAGADDDGHHPFIEGIGQRGSEAYEELLGFETAVYRADALESELLSSGKEAGVGFQMERQVWADCHYRFCLFIRRMRRMANMPAESLAAYRRVTGIFFSPVETVAEFYREGGLKRQQRGETLPIRVPRWVFYPDLPRMPVQIEVGDAQRRDVQVEGTLAGEVENGIYRNTVRITVRARGSVTRATTNMRQNRQIAASVERGRLRLRLLQDEPLAALSVRQGTRAVTGLAVPGGNSPHLLDVDLNRGQPLELTFVRRGVDQMTASQEYQVELSYTDQGADALYDSSATLITFRINVKPSDSSTKTTSTGTRTTGGAPAREEERILAPAQVLAGDVFEVAGAVSAETKKNTRSYNWAVRDPESSSYYGNLIPNGSDALQGRLQLGEEPFYPQFHQSKPLQPRRLILELTLYKQASDPMAALHPSNRRTLSTTFVLKPISLQADLPSGDWKTEPSGHMTGVSMNFRKTFRPSKDGRERAYKADAYIRITTTAGRRSAEEIREQLAANLKSAQPSRDTVTKLEALNAGPFQAYVLVARPGAELKKARDGGVYFVGSVWGFGAKERFCVEIKGQVSASGKAEEAGGVRATADGKVSEILTAIRSLQIQPLEGPVAGSGGAPLQVQLKPAKTRLAPKHSCQIDAVVTGGREPYHYQWEKASTLAGPKATFSSSGKAPGPHKVGLLVRDADGREDRASCTIEVEGTVEAGGAPVETQQGETKPVPPPYKDGKIEQEEIIKRPPPPPPRPPEGKTKRRARPAVYSPPGGGYAIPIPVGWVDRGRSTSGTDRLFASPDGRFVLSCPDRPAGLAVQFKEFRQQLAAALLKTDPKARSEMLDFGGFSGFRVKTTDDRGRTVWFVYMGAGRSCLLFQVLASTPDAPPPPDLEPSWSGLKGTS